MGKEKKEKMKMRVLKVTNSLSYAPFAGLGKLKQSKMNPEKKAKEREKFAGKCHVCGNPLVLVPDTNVMVCSNPECKGHAVKRKDENGKMQVVAHVPTYRCLTERAAKYAEKLFA